MSTRRGVMLAATGAVAGALLPGVGGAQPRRTLPQPRSLAAELEQAIASRKALVVLVSLEGCPYCKLVRESYLVPLRAEGQPVVQVEMARSIPIVDVHGRASTHELVVRASGVRVAPTVLFLGRAGSEAAPALAGMAIPDFYGAYLHDRVAAANRTLAG